MKTHWYSHALSRGGMLAASASIVGLWLALNLFFSSIISQRLHQPELLLVWVQYGILGGCAWNHLAMMSRLLAALETPALPTVNPEHRLQVNGYVLALAVGTPTSVLLSAGMWAFLVLRAA